MLEQDRHLFGELTHFGLRDILNLIGKVLDVRQVKSTFPQKSGLFKSPRGDILVIGWHLNSFINITRTLPERKSSPNDCNHKDEANYQSEHYGNPVGPLDHEIDILL
jgi:hypothetical protein